MISLQKSTFTPEQQAYHIARKQMVDLQLRKAGVTDARVLAAMGSIPRHHFVERGMADQAYLDRPLPIGEGQTISQPYSVGFMTAQLQLQGHEKVLEIGTGCGYQTAVLCSLAKQVYSIERIDRLSHRARRNLYNLSLINFHLRIGDGTLGWPEQAPFDAIIVTAGGPTIPRALLSQLTDGGRFIGPVGGEESQTLRLVTREGPHFYEDEVGDCRFVKLIGAQGWEG